MCLVFHTQLVVPPVWALHEDTWQPCPPKTFLMVATLPTLPTLLPGSAHSVSPPPERHPQRNSGPPEKSLVNALLYSTSLQRKSQEESNDPPLPSKPTKGVPHLAKGTLKTKQTLPSLHRVARTNASKTLTTRRPLGGKWGKQALRTRHGSCP